MMNKKELARLVAHRFDQLTVPEAKEVITTLFEFMALAAENGEEISITNYGKFIPVEKPAKKRYNFQTQEVEENGSRKDIQFKPSMNLMDRINEQGD